MNRDDQFWQDIAPIRNGQRNNFGKRKATALKIGVPYLIVRESNMHPHTRQWTWASALILHFGFFMALLTIPPIELPPKNIVKVEIINTPAPIPNETPVEPSKIIAQPKPDLAQPVPEKTVETEPAPQQKLEPVPDIAIKPPPLDAPLPDAIVNPINLENAKKLKTPAPKQLTQTLPTIEDEPEEQITVPNLRPIAPTPKANLQSRQIELQRPVVPKQIAGQSKLKKQQISKIQAPNVRPIDIEELNRLEAQRALEAARQSEAAPNTAPKVSGGELAPSGGGAPVASGGPPAGPSGVTSVVGGGIPAASGGAPSGGSAPLPRQPRGPVPGRNVFENGEASGGLAGMRRIGECAEINRERSDRCPDWNPLEPGRRNKVDVPVPKSVIPRKTPTDPLPLCPPGTPHSNFGITCLPSGRQ